MRTIPLLPGFLLALSLSTMPTAANADRDYPDWMRYGHMGQGMGMGMGYGMMGYGMGYGSLGPIGMLDLKDDQVKQISKIQDDLAKKHRDLMQKVWDQQGQLNKLYDAEKRDDGAIKKSYAKLSDLHKEMFESRLDADKRIDALLTKEQKEQLKRGYHRWGMMHH